MALRISKELMRPYKYGVQNCINKKLHKFIHADLAGNCQLKFYVFWQFPAKLVFMNLCNSFIYVALNTIKIKTIKQYHTVRQ